MGTAVGVGDARGQRTGVRRELGRQTGLHVVVDTERVGSRPVAKDRWGRGAGGAWEPCGLQGRDQRGRAGPGEDRGSMVAGERTEHGYQCQHGCRCAG